MLDLWASLTTGKTGMVPVPPGIGFFLLTGMERSSSLIFSSLNLARSGGVPWYIKTCGRAKPEGQPGHTESENDPSLQRTGTSGANLVNSFTQFASTDRGQTTRNGPCALLFMRWHINEMVWIVYSSKAIRIETSAAISRIGLPSPDPSRPPGYRSVRFRID
jgi:hypothetical protein